MVARCHFLLFLLLMSTYGSLGKHLDSPPDNEVLPKHVNTNELPYVEALSTEKPMFEVSPDEGRSPKGSSSSADLPKLSVPTTNLSPTKLTNTDGTTNDDLLTIQVSATEVPAIEVPADEVLTTEVPITEVPTTEPPNIQTLKGQITVLIRDTKEVCNRIRNIDIYENIVISTLPLRKSLSYHTRLNKYSEEYNRDLKEMKDHMSFWRKGNDVVGETRSIYGLAKKFQNEFERKLEIWRERILRAPAESQKLRKKLRNEIEDLKRAKANLEGRLDSVDAAVRPYIERHIIEKQSELEEKANEERNSTPLAMELEELVAFLGFVRDDAIIVKNRTINVAKRLKELYNTIQKDNGTSFHYIANITSDLASLTSEKCELEDAFALKNTELQDLEKQLKELDAINFKIRSANDRLIKELGDIRSQSEEKIKIYYKKKEKLCRPDNPFMRVVLPRDWTSTLCDYALRVSGHSLEKDLTDLMESKNRTLTEINLNNDEANNLLTQVNNITEEMRKVKDRMSEIRAKTKEIQTELFLFSMFQSDVERLISGMKTSMPYISETREGLLIVQTTFEFVIGHIDNIISQAESANVEAERQEAKEAVEEGLKLLQEQLSDSSKMMIDVDQCSMLASTVSI